MFFLHFCTFSLFIWKTLLKHWYPKFQLLQSFNYQVYRAKEKEFARAIENYPHKRLFFEMVRFDFVLNSKLQLYLMEANMSPNLSSKHFAMNRLLYEQVSEIWIF